MHLRRGGLFQHHCCRPGCHSGDGLETQLSSLFFCRIFNTRHRRWFRRALGHLQSMHGGSDIEDAPEDPGDVCEASIPGNEDVPIENVVEHEMDCDYKPKFSLGWCLTCPPMNCGSYCREKFAEFVYIRFAWPLCFFLAASSISIRTSNTALYYLDCRNGYQNEIHCGFRVGIFFCSALSIVGLAVVGYMGLTTWRIKADAQDLEEIRPHLVAAWRREPDRGRLRPRRILVLAQDIKVAGVQLNRGQAIQRYGSFRGKVHSLQIFDELIGYSERNDQKIVLGFSFADPNFVTKVAASSSSEGVR